MRITKFEDLECWQEARKLTQMAFRQTSEKAFRQQGFRLTDQMTGAAVSVMNNIVEGFDSQSTVGFIQFLGYARRSASEVQSCLYAALDGRLIDQVQFTTIYQRAESTRKLIDGLRRYLRSHRSAQRANRPTGQPANRLN